MLQSQKRIYRRKCYHIRLLCIQILPSNGHRPIIENGSSEHICFQYKRPLCHITSNCAICAQCIQSNLHLGRHAQFNRLSTNNHIRCQWRNRSNVRPSLFLRQINGIESQHLRQSRWTRICRLGLFPIRHSSRVR